MTTSTQDKVEKMFLRQGTKENLVTFGAHLEDDSEKRRRFSMMAYDGGEVRRMFSRVVVDLTGMEIASQRMPILRNHNQDRIVGHSDEVTVTSKGVMISGFMSQVTQDGLEATQLADEGFPWQASIGFAPGSIQEILAGETIEVNEQTFQGPIDIIRKSTLRESSFVPLGVDGDTESVVFSALAPAAAHGKEEHAMSKDTATTVPAQPTAEEQQKLHDAGSQEAKANFTALEEKYGKEDPAFVLEMFKADKTLDQAEAAWKDRQMVKLQADNEDLAAKYKELKENPTGTSSGADPVGAGGPAGGGDVGFMDRVQHMSDEKKISRPEAMRRIARAEPELHFQYVKEQEQKALERASKSRRGSQ